MKTLAIDFDGTLAEPYDFPHIGAPKPGAAEALRKLKAAGYEIIIHSCRLSRGEFSARDVAQHATAVRIFMRQYDIPFDHLWMEEGKPIAWAYIDDRGIRYEDNWPEIAERLLGPLLPRELKRREDA